MRSGGVGVQVRRERIALVAVLMAVWFVLWGYLMRHNAKIDSPLCVVITIFIRHSATLCDKQKNSQKLIVNQEAGAGVSAHAPCVAGRYDEACRK